MHSKSIIRLVRLDAAIQTQFLINVKCFTLDHDFFLSKYDLDGLLLGFSQLRLENKGHVHIILILVVVYFKYLWNSCLFGWLRLWFFEITD